MLRSPSPPLLHPAKTYIGLDFLKANRVSYVGGVVLISSRSLTNALLSRYFIRIVNRVSNMCADYRKILDLFGFS